MMQKKAMIGGLVAFTLLIGSTGSISAALAQERHPNYPTIEVFRLPLGGVVGKVEPCKKPVGEPQTKLCRYGKPSVFAKGMQSIHIGLNDAVLPSWANRAPATIVLKGNTLLALSFRAANAPENISDSIGARFGQPTSVKVVDMHRYSSRRWVRDDIVISLECVSDTCLVYFSSIEYVQYNRAQEASRLMKESTRPATP